MASYLLKLVVAVDPLRLQLIGVALQSKTGRVSCVCDWLRDATGLDFGDRPVVDLQRDPEVRCI